MPIRRLVLPLLVVVVAAAPLSAATIRTPNFVVTAPDPQMAQQFGQMAEHYRKQKAIEWLGREMEPWPQPCPLHVKPTMSGAGGATQFNYGNGNYTVISMNIEGPVERMLNSVLPHEVTHTVFAHHFRYPVPRWADEGGAVLSEDDQERQRHDLLCRHKLNTPGATIPLRRLFNLKEYHEVSDVMVIYAQGYSVSNFLVGQSDRQTFLNFVATGMRYGWDRGLQQYYGFQSVEQLEEAWLQHLRATRETARQPRKNGNGQLIASGPQPGAAAGNAMSREVVRLTAPPAQPQLDPAGPIFRGQSNDDARPASRAYPITPPTGVVPLGPTPRPVSHSSPTTQRRELPPPVILGLPEYAPSPQTGPLKASGPSPVGFQK
jgi:hypothetical protein